MPRTIVEPRKLPFISGPGDCAHREIFAGDLGIDHGRSDVEMAEQLLNGSDIITGSKKVYGTCCVPIEPFFSQILPESV
jgi:hypothetical protein